MSETVTPTVTPMRQRVAEEIRVLLARRRMSGSELARRIGVTQPYMSRRLMGEIAFDVDDLDRIGEALGVRPAALLSSPVATGESPAKRGEHRLSRHDTPAFSRPKATGRPPSYPTNLRRPALIGHHRPG